MPLDDTALKALQMYGQGVSGALRDIGITRTLMGANEAAQQIRASTIDEAQKRLQLEDLSRQFSMQMVSHGASIDGIKQIADSIAPPIRAPQTAEEAMVSPDKTTRQRGFAASSFQQEQALEKDRLKMEAKAPSITDFKTRRTIMKDFEGLADVKQGRKTLTALDEIDGILNEGTTESLNMAVKALISAKEGGRVSDVDFKLAFPGRSIPERASQAFWTGLVGESTGGNVTKMRSLVNTIKQSAQKRLDERTRNYSKSTAASLRVPQAEVEELVAGKALGPSMQRVPMKYQGKLGFAIYENGEYKGWEQQ